jgi:hypothetical protein
VVAVVHSTGMTHGYAIFRGSSLMDVADQIEESRFAKEGAMTIRFYRDVQKAAAQYEQLCGYADAMRGLMHGGIESDRHSQHIGAMLLRELTEEISSLSDVINGT